MRGIAGNFRRTAATTSTSQRGLILILIRRYPRAAASDLPEQVLHAGLDPETDARGDLLDPAPEHHPERLSLDAREEIEDRHLDPGLGHRMAAHEAEELGDRARPRDLDVLQPRGEKVADDMPGRLDGLVAVAGRRRDGRLPPPRRAAALGSNEDRLLFRDAAEARLEWMDERHPQVDEFEAFDLHGRSSR